MQMSSDQTKGKDARHLRDTLAVLQESLPKRRRVEMGSLEIREDSVEREILQEDRKDCLKKLVPILISGPFTKQHYKSVNVGEEVLNAEKCTIEDDKTKDETKPNDNAKPKEEKKEIDITDSYKQRLLDLKKDEEELKKKRHDMFHNYAKLIFQYEDGLKHIANLNSLAQCPDNVMNGNFESIS